MKNRTSSNNNQVEMEPTSPSVDDTIITPSRDQGVARIELMPEQAGISESERFYEVNGRTSVCLITLCTGLKNPEGGGRDLIDINEEPWKTESKSSIKPKPRI